MRTDGSVIIDTKILDDGMEQGFERIKSDVGSVADEAQKAARNIKATFEQMDVSGPVESAIRKVRDLEKQLEAVTAEHKFAIKEDDDKGAERLARKMTSIYDRLEAARERLAREVEKAAHKQAKAEEKAAERSRKAAEKEARAQEKAMQKAYKSATKGARRFGTRLTEILSGALIFNAISRGLREVTSYFGDALKTNEQYRQSVARLKGALLTAFQPIYEYVLPGIIKLIDYLTMGAQAVAQFFASLSGKSVKQMSQNAEKLYDEAKGMDAVAESAEEAKRQLMGFDEINKLSDKNEKNKTTDKNQTILPSFEDINGADKLEFSKIIEPLKTILGYVGAIAAGLVAWEIGKIFMDGLGKAAGLALGIGGAFLYAYSWVDALVNGISWENFSGMMIGLGVAVAGFSIAFGPLGAAITLLIGGLGMAVLAMKEWIETGEISNEACAVLVAGILAIGAAFTIFTANWIPLVVAAVVAFAALIAAKGDAIKEALNKFSNWLKNIFSRDWTEVFGFTLGTIINEFVQTVGGVLGGLKEMFFGLIDVLTGIFTMNWKKVWDGLITIAKGAINGVISVVNGMIRAVTNAINGLFRLLSFKINLPGGGNIGLSLPQVTAPQIPYLATGAVIPPNAPFMAVLGDQKNGTNIEAPADLIRQILREELANTGDSMTAELLRELISVVENISVGDETIGRAAARYNRRASRAGGY